MADPPPEHDSVTASGENAGHTNVSTTAVEADPVTFPISLTTSPLSITVDRNNREPRRVSTVSSLANKEDERPPKSKWTLGVLSDRHTDEVPGMTRYPQVLF